jgi:hypothetical protein
MEVRNEIEETGMEKRKKLYQINSRTVSYLLSLIDYAAIATGGMTHCQFKCASNTQQCVTRI